MKCLDALYICTTPFQIMSAISLAVNRKEKADLYIDVQFEGAEELAEKLRERKIFDCVHLLKDVQAIKDIRFTKGRMARYRKMMYWFRHVEKAAEEILLPDREYKTLYATHYIIPATMLILYFSKYDIRTRMHFFDDGESSYFNQNFYKSSMAERTARRWVLKGKKLRKVRRLYLYSPDIFRRMNPTETIPVFQLPRFNDSDAVKEHLKAVFDVTEDKGIREPVVILDNIKESVLPENECKRLVNLYKRMHKEFGDENIIIKRHPRDPHEDQTGIREYPYKIMPFEIICLASDSNRMNLVTLSSTATFMPKLLLDQEPRIVLLHRVFHRPDWNDEDTNRLFDIIRESYRKPERICIPETEEELEGILRNIREELTSNGGKEV